VLTSRPAVLDGSLRHLLALTLVLEGAVDAL